MEQNRNTLRYIGLGPEHPAADTIVLPEATAYDVFDASGTPVTHRNPERMTRYALTGTSFSARRKVPKFLTHFAQETVWNGAQQGATLLGNVNEFVRRHARTGCPSCSCSSSPCTTSSRSGPTPARCAGRARRPSSSPGPFRTS